MACQYQKIELNDDMMERRITGVTQSSCHLDWSLEDGDNNDKVAFIIAGVDHTGIINVISGSIQDTMMKMTPAMTTKFVKMTVLVVNTDGLPPGYARIDLTGLDIQGVLGLKWFIRTTPTLPEDSAQRASVGPEQDDPVIEESGLVDLQHGLGDIGVHVTRDDCQLFFQRYDKDRDGRLDYREFA